MVDWYCVGVTLIKTSLPVVSMHSVLASCSCSLLFTLVVHHCHAVRVAALAAEVVNSCMCELSAFI
jgi:hypothetical protein